MEMKNGDLRTIETTSKLLHYMYDCGMIVRAWYTDTHKDVMGTDTW